MKNSTTLQNNTTNKPLKTNKMKFKIGTEVAFNMNCPCGECEDEQGYITHIINGTETKDFLKRCVIFSEETMKKLR